MSQTKLYLVTKAGLRTDTVVYTLITNLMH